MRVLLLTNFPPAPGGLEVFTSDLTVALGGEIEFVIAGLRAHGNASKASLDELFPLPHKGTLRAIEGVVLWPRRPFGLWRRLRSVHRLRAFIDDVAPDVILCQSSDFLHPYLAVLQLTGLLRAPIAYAFHMPFRPMIAHHPRYLMPLLRVALARAHVTIAVSQALGAELTRELSVPAARLRTIHSPIDSRKIRALMHEPVTDLPFDDALPFLVHVARIDPLAKNQALLVAAFERALEHVDAHLVIVGPGHSDEGLRRLLAAPRLAGRVHLLGWRDNPYKYMRRAAALVLSSNYEGMGLVLAEALACGCPVLSTDCEFGPSEILDKGAHGLLTPVGDVPAMAAAMVRLLSDGALRERLSTGGPARAEAFDCARIHADYRTLFFELAGRSARDTPASSG